MSSPCPFRLHKGQTTHRRFKPFSSSFTYKVALIDLDIDQLERAGRQTRLFSVEGVSLFGFRRKDHGAHEEGALRPWAESRFREAGIDVPNGPIRLVTFPRHFFYKFAPISLWIALDRQHRPAAIIYEVRNTFGERHAYAANLEGSWSRHVAPKSFHVSPFFDVSGKYQFSFQYSDTAIKLGVTTTKDGVPSHMASLSTASQPATDRALAALAVRMPLSTIGVTFGIHWEALKLWVKGARYHHKPTRPDHGLTRATPDPKHN